MERDQIGQPNPAKQWSVFVAAGGCWVAADVSEKNNSMEKNRVKTAGNLKHGSCFLVNTFILYSMELNRTKPDRQ